MRELIGSWNGQTEVAQQTVIDGVDPSVNGDILRPVPSVLDYGCLANVDNLLNDVQLAEQIMALRRVAIARQSRRMLLLHVLHVAQPVVNQPQFAIGGRSKHASATIVPADNDMFDTQDIHGILNHG